MKSILILLLGVCFVQARKTYEGYKVLSVTPSTPGQVEFLRRLMVSDVNVDFWKEPTHIGEQVDVMIGPDHLSELRAKLTSADLLSSVFIDNVREHIETPTGKNTIDQHIFNINDFNTLDDIYAWLQVQTGNCAVGVTCQLYSVGNSHEGRPIYVFQLSRSGTGRKAYWVDATIHAREWIAPATLLQLLNHFIKQGDATVTDLLNRYDWYFLPVMNPDGYEFTWTDDRLWRKNRRQNTDAGSLCFGTDLNRNFDFRWGHDGVSFEPCSETYCGPSGGSEPETQVVSAELVRLGPTLAASVTLHSYGYMWMFPWGNTVNYNGIQCDLAADHDELMRVADLTADAIENTYNSRWDRGNSCVVIYATTGGTDDYAKGAAGVKYAFCPELRGNSFIIDSSNIVPSFNEIFNGIVAMVNAINA